MPHDVMVRELGTGRTRIEVAGELGLDVTVAPKISVEDGIQAVRTLLPICWFDATLAANGVSALKSYQQGKNGKPLHNWASHGADGFRHLAISIEYVTGWNGSNIIQMNGPLRRRIRGIY
jgi:hypothetical protein